LSFLRRQESSKINRFPLKTCGNDGTMIYAINPKNAVRDSEFGSESLQGRLVSASNKNN